MENKKVKRVFVALNKFDGEKITPFESYEDFLDQEFRQCTIYYDDDGYPSFQGNSQFIDKYELSIWNQGMLCKWVPGIRGPYLAELKLLPELGHLEDIWQELNNKQ